MRNLPRLIFALSVVAMVQLIYSVSIVHTAENLDRFWSLLTGDQQLQPVTTDAIGYVGLKF